MRAFARRSDFITLLKSTHGPGTFARTDGCLASRLFCREVDMRLIQATTALVAALALTLAGGDALARGGGHGGAGGARSSGGAHFSGGGLRFSGGGGGAKFSSFNSGSRSFSTVTRFSQPRTVISSQHFASHTGNRHHRRHVRFIGAGFYPSFYDDYPYYYDSDYYNDDTDDDLVCYWSSRYGRRICRQY
jgi:hypothetical protein